jgi:hypothetical protein
MKKPTRRELCRRDKIAFAMKKPRSESTGALNGPVPRVVVLEGSPSQMGLAHGRLLAQEINFLIRQVDRHVFQRVGPIQGVGLAIVARTFAHILGRNIPSHLQEEIRGIAEASGCGYADLLLMNTLDDVLNILRRLAPRAPSIGCSSFALYGTRTHDGDVLHGRNLDYHFRGTPLDDNGEVSRLLLRNATLFVYHPSDRAPFVSIGWPGIVGVVTGMNEARICLSNLTSYLRGTTPNGIPTPILYRTIAEQASSLQDVGQLLREARRTIGNNLLVSSGVENRAALFEITRDTVAEVPPEDGGLVATNHFVTPDLARRQRPYLLAHSVARWKRLRDLCDRRSIGREDALGFLADEGGGEPCHPFARVANEGTAVSILFLPVARELWIGSNREPPASGREFRRVNVASMLTAGIASI